MDIQKKIGQLNNTAHQSKEPVLMAILRTTIEMLRDRGYSNVQACQSVDQVISNMSDSRHIVSGSGPNVIHVFFHNEERVGVKTLRTWVENSVADRIIVASLEGPTAFTRKEAEQYYKQVQFFMFRDLCVNITKHTLVPLHEKITKEMVPVKVSNEQMPQLWTNDKVSQYYAFEVGDIVRITRTCGTQEPIYYYRIVRSPPVS